MSRDPEPGEPGYVEPPYKAAQRAADERAKQRAKALREARVERRKNRKYRAQRRNDWRDAGKKFPWPGKTHLIVYREPPPVLRPINIAARWRKKEKAA